MHLYVERGPGAGQLIPVRQGQVSIGRASASDLRLLHPSISRYHAQLVRQGDRFFLRDLGSQNGTFVNRTRVSGEVELQPGDEIALGQALLRLRSQDVAHAHGGARARRRWTFEQLRSRGVLTRWAVFTAAVAVGFAGVSMATLYRVTREPRAPIALPLAPDATQMFTQRTSPGRHPKKPAVRAQRIPIDFPGEGEASESPATRPAAAATANAGTAPAPAPAKAAETSATASPSPQAPPVLPADALASVTPLPEVTEQIPGPSLVERLRSTETPQERFRGGDAVGAKELAEESGNTALAQQLARFQRTFTEAHLAIESANAQRARRLVQSAQKQESTLSGGKGWYRRELQRDFGAVLALEADEALSAGDTLRAKANLEQAIRHDPDNTAFRARLQGLPAVARPVQNVPKRSTDPRTAAIEAAFGS
ncbi:MAG: FHA domain-containing protein [Myxococcaceae bacterium]